MQRVLQRRGNAEVAAAAAQRPEQVAVLLGAGMDQMAFSGDHVGGDEVVAGKAVLAQQPADAPAQREPAKPGGGDQAAGRGQAERLRLVVEIGPRSPALRDRTAGLRIDLDCFHQREIENHPTVGRREPGNAVRAAAHRERQALAARELHRRDHVGGTGAADDQRRILVMGGVPDRTCFVVVIVTRPYHLTPDRSLQLARRGFAHHVPGIRHRHWPSSAFVDGADVMARGFATA